MSSTVPPPHFISRWLFSAYVVAFSMHLAYYLSFLASGTALGKIFYNLQHLFGIWTCAFHDFA